MKNSLRLRTVKLVARIMKPFVEEGIILVSEEKEIIKNLRHLAQKNCLAPAITPKLIDKPQVAEILGIGFSHFKNMEKEGRFPFKRRMVGSAIRFSNIEIYNYVLNSPTVPQEDIVD